jgi:hypothetical protein
VSSELITVTQFEKQAIKLYCVSGNHLMTTSVVYGDEAVKFNCVQLV